MEGIELISFKIISCVGTARSLYIEAIDYAIDGKIEEAESVAAEAFEAYIEGARAHSEILSLSTNEDGFSIPLLLMHAEDQMMSAETFSILASKFIDLAKKQQ